MKMRKPILALLALLFGAPAHADILWTGGLPGIGDTNVGVYGGGASHRTSFSSASMWCAGTTADPPTNYIRSDAFTGQSTVWITWRAMRANNYTNTNTVLFRALDGSTPRLYIRGATTGDSGSNGSLKIEKRTAAGTYTTLASTVTCATSSTLCYNATTDASVPRKYDLKIIYGTSGEITLYQNGVSIASYTGDVTTDSATSLSKIELCDARGGAGGENTAISEIIVANADTRGMALWTLHPQAAGTTQNWTPSTVGNVAKSALNDATYVSTNANDTLSGWTTPTSAPTGNWNVLAITQNARVQRSVTGPQSFAYYCRSGGTDNVGADIGANTGFTNHAQKLWATNCTSGAAWAIGDIASGFNLGIKSRP